MGGGGDARSTGPERRAGRGGGAEEVPRNEKSDAEEGKNDQVGKGTEEKKTESPKSKAHNKGLGHAH